MTSYTGHRRNSDLKGDETIVTEAMCYDYHLEDNELNKVNDSGRGEQGSDARRDMEEELVKQSVGLHIGVRGR